MDVDAVSSQEIQDRPHRPSRPAACRRNGVAFQAEPQQQQWDFVQYDHVSNTRAHAMLTELAVPSFTSSTHNPRAWLRSVQECFVASSVNLDTACHLPNLIQRCTTLRSREVGLSFVAMISAIQLAFKCERYVGSLSHRCHQLIRRV